jgi:four helix bundle protein
MNDFSENLESRCLKFSQSIIILCGTIKETAITRPLISQLVRSATSVGANYAEANNASSKTDFRNKIYIAKKEANETKYWLKLLAPTNETLLQEIQELILIFQSIINTLNRNRY